MGELLAVRGLSAGYGRGDIVRQVDMTLVGGEVATIIGPNGAGKSTLIKAIAGVLRPSAGEVRLGTDRVDGLRASKTARLGMAFVPQEANVFRALTVRENLEISATWIAASRRAHAIERVFGKYPLLAERSAQRAGSLSGGERQMVALCMALMVEPRVLLLDEPSAGLSPRLVEGMLEFVRAIADDGTGVLMVEQNAIQGLRVSNRGYVMAAGSVKLEATAQALLDDPRVTELYLGKRV